MEGFRSENPDDKEPDVSHDSETTDKDKKSARKKAAGALHSRINERATEELSKNRQKAKENLGSFSLDAFGVDSQKATQEKPSILHPLISEQELVAKEDNESGESQQPLQYDDNDPVVDVEGVTTVNQEDNTVESGPADTPGVDVDVEWLEQPTNEAYLQDVELVGDADVNAAQHTDSASANTESMPEVVMSSIPAEHTPVVDVPPLPRTPFAHSSANGASQPSQSSRRQPLVPPAARQMPPAGSVNSGGSGPNMPYNGPPLYPTPPVPVYNTAPSNPVPVAETIPTPPKIEQRIIEKHNHFIAGLMVGGLYEHFKHKKRENKPKKQVEAQDAKIAANESRLISTQDEVTTLQRNQAIQKENQKWQEKAVNNIEQAAPIAAAEQTARVIVEKTSPQKAAELPVVPLAEGASTQTRYETASPVQRTEQVAYAANNERATAQEEKPVIIIAEDEPVVVASDRRVEVSSWHRIEIDKATGRPVENPTVAYGEAFQMERQQEVKAQDVAIPTDADSGTVSSGVGTNTTGAPAASQQSTISTHTPSISPAATVLNRIEETQRVGNPGRSVDSVSIVLWAVLAVLVVAIVYIMLR